MDDRERLVEAYLASTAIRNLLSPYESLEETHLYLSIDAAVVVLLSETRYLQPHQYNTPRSSQIPLLWQYAEDPKHHHRFIHLVRLSPLCFHILLTLVEGHPAFTSHSNKTQTPVEIQLAVTLYRIGRYGNGASVTDVANWAGISEGSVENYTKRCLLAIESLQKRFVRCLSDEEKEKEKRRVEQEIGFSGGLWREGWAMYDGTIVVLFRCPEQHGDVYFTRKSNYGLNVQVRVNSCYIQLILR